MRMGWDRWRRLTLATALGCVLGASDPPPVPEPGEASKTEADDRPATVDSPFAGFWLLRMERTIWWPRRVPGTLAVHATEDGLRASVTLDRMWGPRPTRLELGTPEDDFVEGVIALGGEHDTPLQWTVDGDDLWGAVSWDSRSGVDQSVLRARRVTVQRFENDSRDEPFPLEQDPAAVGVDPAALDRLIHYASRRDTDALIVVKDGHLLCDRTFLRRRMPIDVGEITASIAALAPALVEDEKGAVHSLDLPLARAFAVLGADHQGAQLTLRHLLSNTTGLGYPDEDAWDGPTGRAELVLAAGFEHAPGSRSVYHPDAFELLSPLVERLFAKPLDALMKERLFARIGVGPVAWERDGKGRPSSSTGLVMHPMDLARIGAVLAAEGRWDGEVVVDPDWIAASFAPVPQRDEQGLGWRVVRFADQETVEQTTVSIERLKALGYPHAQKLEPLVGRTFDDRRGWAMAAYELLGEKGLEELTRYVGREGVGASVSGPIAMARSVGFEGQQLLVLPNHDLVVVRLRRELPEGEADEAEGTGASFEALERLVLDLPLR